MAFVLGQVPWNNGIEQTDEVKQKIGRANRGKIRTAEARLRMGASHRGRKHSEETKRKMSLSKWLTVEHSASAVADRLIPMAPNANYDHRR